MTECAECGSPTGHNAMCSVAIRERNSEIVWYRSALVSLLVLAEADKSPLTNQNVASICKHTLGKYTDGVSEDGK